MAQPGKEEGGIRIGVPPEVSYTITAGILQIPYPQVSPFGKEGLFFPEEIQKGVLFFPEEIRKGGAVVYFTEPLPIVLCC